MERAAGGSGGARAEPPLRYNAAMVRCAACVLVVLVAAVGCGLRLDGVTAEVAPGGTLEITGAGFTDATQFSLVGLATVSLALTEVAPSSARATVPNAAPAGLYDLRATANGADATLAEAVQVVSGGLDVHFLDVDQGDATLVVAPGGATLLIDGGPRSAGPVVKEAVRTLARGRLDAVVLSHTDADHLGGLVELLQGDDGAPGTDDDLTPTLRLAGVDDGSCTTQVCQDLRALRAWPFDTPDVGDAVTLPDADGVDVTVVAVDGDVGAGRVAGVDDENERSVAVSVSFGGATILVTGDLTGGGLGEADVETPLATRTGPVDVLRASHHGSATSSAAMALDVWQPRAVVLSLGTDNSYCHPAADVVTRLAGLGAPLYVTGEGVVVDTAGCASATAWPAQARTGLGTISLTVRADGSATIAGDPL